MMNYFPLALMAGLPLLRSVGAAPAPRLWMPHAGATVTVTVTLPCSASAALPSVSPSHRVIHAAEFAADVASSSVAAVSSASLGAPSPSSVSGSVGGASVSIIEPSASHASGTVGSASPVSVASSTTPSASGSASSVKDQDMISLATSLENFVSSLINNAGPVTLLTNVGTFQAFLEQLHNFLRYNPSGLTSVQTTYLNNAFKNALSTLANLGSQVSLPSNASIIQPVIHSLYLLSSDSCPSAGDFASWLQEFLHGRASNSASIDSNGGVIN